ncbi:mechanosensitive ion channel domain-containing protein [Lewinella sp. 4G2]|uniref:mechanosensitive ion channel domain-containing protein n=1 Tax=Lewinella sp. 4G2 TaxID=1803372 RepID=UPI0007B4D00C|nr:mechanosensitive ion channel domain-containing protein [Lewinella sp. 4G2]OAV45582.1 hypothetical protein A3850_014250 [Lewinella sp. 4G2]
MGGSVVSLVAVLLLFPVAVVVLGEIIIRLKVEGRDYAKSVSLARNVVVPLLAIYFLVTRLGNFGGDHDLSKLVLTAVIIVGLAAVMGIINGVLFETSNSTQKVPKLFLDLGRILVIVVGIGFTLSYVWGKDLSSLATALGVSSIVLGLALQDTLGNLFNGITLINERPFQVGDFIEVDGHAGRVVEVNWRAVRLLTRERDLIVLPHIKVSQSAIMNHSQPEVHWAQKLMLGFSYDHAPNFVKRVMLEVCEATPGIMAFPEPEVKVDDFADSAVVYEIEYYIENYGLHEDVKNDFMTRVWYAAKRNGIDIPYPQVNIHQEPQLEKQADEDNARSRHLDFAIKMLNIPEDVEHIADEKGVELLSYGEGENIINYNINNTGLYLLVSGEVQLLTRSAAGVPKMISELHRGDFINQILQTGSRKNIVAAKATEDSEVIYFPQEIVRRLVNRYPQLAHRTEEIMVSRRQQIKKIKAVTENQN